MLAELQAPNSATLEAPLHASWHNHRPASALAQQLRPCVAASLQGMHGVRLRPGSSVVELRVRLYNRTPLTQTFLWCGPAACALCSS